MLVENGHEEAFDAYLTQESCEVVAWLDSTESLDSLRMACSRIEGGST